MTLELLAADVLALLELQRQYFATPHGTDEKQSLLVRCKEREGRLKKACQEIVSPPKEKPKSLFDQINEEG